MADEKIQNLQFCLGEIDFFSVDSDNFLHHIQHEMFELFLSGHVSAASSEHSLDSGDNFSNGKRLGNIVVGYNVETLDHIIFSVFCGYEDNWNVGRLGFFADLLRKLETRNLVHHDIKQDEVEICDADSECFFTRM